LIEEYLQPISASFAGRPDGKVSLLVYGPPGTRKTTLVGSLAAELNWPLLTLSPPDFLTRGLEGLEARAGEVFRDLERLRQVVVLFDECDEFFKRRGDGAEHAESRTMGAFLTAGMLPRLQRLRDDRWVVFVAAMNSRLGQLDEAAIRPGRFDYLLRLDHPTPGAQRRYVRRLQERAAEAVRKATDDEADRDTRLKELSTASDVLCAALRRVEKMHVPRHVKRSGSKTTGVSFDALEKAWRWTVREIGDGRGDEDLVDRASDVLSGQRRKGPPSLI
jgi:SpoVK/Ycf46/Vps4 family AAA+-type ATPase